MKIKLVLIALIAAFALGTTWLGYERSSLVAERDAYKQNTATLLTDIYRYQVNDSLNAATVSELTLRISEYERYRAEDAALIKALRLDVNRVQKVTTVQTGTINHLRAELQGRTLNSQQQEAVTLQCIDINEPFFDLEGCVNVQEQSFEGTLKTRENLMYVEHIVPHRFLFIKWGCKERKQEIVSRNLNTTIVEAEFITLKM